MSVETLGHGMTDRDVVDKAAAWDAVVTKNAEIERLKFDNQEIMRINNGLREAMLAIKALCAGDKIPNWKDDWTTTATRGRIMDIIDTTVR